MWCAMVSLPCGVEARGVMELALEVVVQSLLNVFDAGLWCRRRIDGPIRIEKWKSLA
jgi:hypothetical protein